MEHPLLDDYELNYVPDKEKQIERLEKELLSVRARAAQIQKELDELKGFEG